jgi:hypothetical protein
MRAYAKNGHCEDNLGTALFSRIHPWCTIVETCSRHERAIGQAIKHRGVAKRLDLGWSGTVHSSALLQMTNYRCVLGGRLSWNSILLFSLQLGRQGAKNRKVMQASHWGCCCRGTNIVFPHSM